MLRICVQNARFVQVVSCFHLIDWNSVFPSFPLLLISKHYFFTVLQCCVHNSALKIDFCFVLKAQKLIKHRSDQGKGQFKEARPVQGKEKRGHFCISSGAKGMSFKKLKKQSFMTRVILTSKRSFHFAVNHS